MCLPELLCLILVPPPVKEKLHSTQNPELSNFFLVNALRKTGLLPPSLH